MRDVLAIALVSGVVPASLIRLWYIWWKSDCGACGFTHSACTCPQQGPMMRPRK